ncbi:polysaccharide export protein [Hyphomonadaceae bacterium BL14]|nr:polysaccharide export protein [Hyphomonadaceae bacterium BL14]
MRIPISQFAALIAGALVVSGCGATTPAAGEVTLTTEALQVMGENVYTLGVGDQLRVSVFGEEDLSGEFVIDGSGSVSMPLVGEVRARGLTVREFRTELETILRNGYLNDPRVNAEVINFRPFFIMGEVESSGEYPYSDGLTVINAIARAGGFTYRANTRVVFIKRAGASEEVAVPMTATLRVMPGDTIRVGERFF